MNKQYKISRLLASYIDFAILLNLVTIAKALANIFNNQDVRLMVSVILYLTILIFHLFKDAFFNHASIGKHLLGLKLESTSDTQKGDSALFVRNLPSCLFLILFLIEYGFSNTPLVGYTFLLVYVVFNLIFFCCKPNKKIGDCIAKLQVVEDTDNKIWKETNSEKKGMYVTIVAFLITLSLISVLSLILPFLSRMSWLYSQYFELIFKGIIPMALKIFTFFIYYKIVNNFVDNALLKKLMIVCACAIMLVSMSEVVRKFIMESFFFLH